MSNLTVDITPDKSLIKKLGLVGYRTEQAVAELIDNSIDARLDGMETIKVILDFRLGQITVSDDGCGMDSEGLRDALTVARETKNGKLGQFGLGLKSACSSLGKSFTLRTSAPDSRHMLTASYDEDRWLNDESKNWTNFEINESDKEGGWHGTRITVSKIKVPLYPNQLRNFRKRFGIRYGPYLKRGHVKILVNSHPCQSSAPDLLDGTRHEVEITTSGGRMAGWVGLLVRRSIKGDYGIHLYRNGRLISAFDKFGMIFHPEAARVVGELSLDHVPVNFQKTGFLTESPEYREAVLSFMADPTVKKIMRRASSSKAGVSDINSVLTFEQDPSLPRLDSRMSSENAKLLLQKAGLFVQEKDGTAFNFEFDNSDTFRIAADGDKIRVGIGRNSPTFRLFKNPLFLIGLIRIEAGLAAEDPSYRAFIERRNKSLNKFIRDRLPGPAGSGAPRKSAVPLPGYSLQNELIELHDHLKESFEHSFQFTGLSTLAPFLHNAHSKMVYTVHTVRGAGQGLLEAITGHTDAFVVRLNPRKLELAALLDGPEYAKFIVIREYGERLPLAWAKPEKAWLDLYFDVTRERIPLYHDELVLILDGLLDAGLATPAKLRSLARRRQLDKEIEEYLPEE